MQPRLDGSTVADLIVEARRIVEEGRDRWQPRGVYALFSGGNDSTVMLDIVRGWGIDGVIHIDTTIGIAATRQFVRDTCQAWNLLLFEASPSKSFDEIVRSRGFFGPSDHPWAYRLLKKDAVRQVKRRLLTPGGRDRLMFLTGMRSAESGRRMAHGALDRLEERIAWVNPIRHFTSDDMKEYRRMNPALPRNPVNDALGKSGECLCGCFSVGPVELPIIRDLDPATADQIEALQTYLRDQGSPFCEWGRGGEMPTRPAGPLCSSCDAQLGLDFGQQQMEAV